eukprot:TRINITY_DN66339_c0_g1_i1.p1 TRINITY_DN66339_c0_g1~~TRINITY_DN66339_c0_g1_i1.p1  ORF type:complete len:183 (+),score=28.71 TRINITY_DN66339_c0_g1_i1:45-551(+)
MALPARGDEVHAGPLAKFPSAGRARPLPEVVAAAQASAKQRRWQETLQLVAEVVKATGSHDVKVVSIAIASCKVGHRWPLALALLSELRGSAVRLNVVPYNAAITACEKGQQWAVALLLFQMMQTDRLQPDLIAYNAAMSACAKGSRWRAALSFFVSEIGRASCRERV